MVAKRKKQTPRGKKLDDKITAKKTLSNTKANRAKWTKNKARMDIAGKDTKYKLKGKKK